MLEQRSCNVDRRYVLDKPPEHAVKGQKHRCSMVYLRCTQAHLEIIPGDMSNRLRDLFKHTGDEITNTILRWYSSGSYRDGKII